MDSNQKQGHIVAILIMIFALFVAGLISVLISQTIGNETKPYKETESNKKSPQENTNKKEEVPSKVTPTEPEKKENEVEVSIDKYKYLLDRIHGNIYNSTGHNLSKYLNYNTMSIEQKIFVAVAQLEEEKTVFNANDKCDIFGEIKECNDMVENVTKGYSISKIDNKIKEIFGKNTVIKHSSNKPLIYDITAKAYFIIASGNGDGPVQIEKITKITTKSNELYIYVVAGSLDYYNKVCFDIDFNDNNCMNISEKYTKQINRDGNTIEDFNNEADQLLTDYKDKFAKYKYTFEKEDNNYIIKKLEKID